MSNSNDDSGGAPLQAVLARPTTPGPGASAGVAPSSCGCGGSCGGLCGGNAASSAGGQMSNAINVYAMGKIRPHIPNLGLEKEIAQTVGRVFSNGPSDEEALCKLLVMDEHRRLANDVCWTFAVEGIDTYVLKPADSVGLSLILGALRADKSSTAVDVVIGRAVGKTGFAECNGKMLPTLTPSQIYSMDRSSLLKTLPSSKDIAHEAMKSAVKQTLDVTAQIGGNYGTSDAHRALNYAATRSAELYQAVATNLLDNWALSGFNSRPSALTGGRRVVDVVLIFRSRVNDAVRKSFMRVDVTDLYPFMVSPIQPFLEFN